MSGCVSTKTSTTSDCPPAEKCALKSSREASCGTFATKALKGGRSGMGMPDWELEEGAGAGGLEDAASVAAVGGLLAASGAAAASDGVEMMGTSTGGLFVFF